MRSTLRAVPAKGSCPLFPAPGKRSSNHGTRAMRRARIGLVAAAGCLLPWSLGCCPMKCRGAISRVGSTLGLDRLPGLGSAACTAPDGQTCGCQQGVGCGHGGACAGHGGCAGACIAEADHIHSRFHPVPTRPVFWPRPAPFPPIAGGPFPLSPGGMAAPVQFSSFQADRPPGPIEIRSPQPSEEEVPPAPLPPGDREVQVPRPSGHGEVQVPRPLRMASSTRSWMFPARAAHGGGNAGQGQALRTNEGPVIR